MVFKGGHKREGKWGATNKRRPGGIGSSPPLRPTREDGRWRPSRRAAAVALIKAGPGRRGGTLPRLPSVPIFAAAPRPAHRAPMTPPVRPRASFSMSMPGWPSFSDTSTRGFPAATTTKRRTACTGRADRAERVERTTLTRPSVAKRATEAILGENVVLRGEDGPAAACAEYRYFPISLEPTHVRPLVLNRRRNSALFSAKQFSDRLRPHRPEAAAQGSRRRFA